MYGLRSSVKNLLKHRYYYLGGGGSSYRINQRSFHQNRILRKDEKTKELLKNLGLNLQKGTINRSNKTKDNNNNKSGSSVKNEKTNDNGDENEGNEGNVTRINENDNGDDDKTDNQLVSTVTDIPPDPNEIETKSTKSNDNNNNNNNSNTIKTNSHGNNNLTASNGINNKKISSEPNKNKKLMKPTKPGKLGKPGKLNKIKPSNVDENIVHEQLENAFVTVALMTNKEFLEQIALDGRNFPFKHFKSDYLIDRQEILRQIPDMINIFNKQDMKKIEQIYQNLSKLDQDKSMHLQFLKQSFIDYKNDLLYLDQFLRGINLKFKQYRRGEVRYFFVYPTVFEHVHDKILHQYNVVGFDRSLFGMPLDKQLDKLVLPREFIQDLPQFDNIIELNKIDASLGFKLVEEQQFGKLIDSLWDPRMVKPLKELQKEYKERLNEQKKDKNQQLEKQLQPPLKSKDDTINGKQPDKKFIVIKKGGYRQIKLKESSLQYSPVIRRIEEEIELMINDLNKQIKTTLESDNIKVLIPNENENENKNDKNDKETITTFTSPTGFQPTSRIKTNFYEIVFKEKIYQGYLVSVERLILKNFNILPNYALLYHKINYPPLIKRKLLNHIFKIFLININEKFNYLQKIKYLTQRQQIEFHKKLIKQIKYIIRFKLLRYFDNNTLNQTTNSLKLNNLNVFHHEEEEEEERYDNNFDKSKQRQRKTFGGAHAVIFNPYTDNCFKRIYWISSPYPSSIIKRQNMNLKRKFTKIKFKTIDERYITTTIA